MWYEDLLVVVTRLDRRSEIWGTLENNFCTTIPLGDVEVRWRCNTRRDLEVAYL